MGTFDRISRIVRAEMNSQKSQSSYDSNQQTRELEEQAISLRRQIANLEATNKDSMSSALRQEYATTISNLKRSLATLEQAIVNLGGNIDSSTDDAESEATKINFNQQRTVGIDEELEELKRSLEEL
jgi:chromosome segregation ATPase